MKVTEIGLFPFVPASKTIDFAAITGFNLARLYMIVNITTNTLIFVTGQPLYGFASITGTVVTFTSAMAGMASTDKLQIIYDEPNTLVKSAIVSTSTMTNVASSLTSVTLLAANANRLPGTLILNDSTSILLVAFGPTASATAASFKLLPVSGVYEFPLSVYPGIVTGIWGAANGSARMTELT